MSETGYEETDKKEGGNVKMDVAQDRRESVDKIK